jgi:hypothetical protein
MAGGPQVASGATLSVAGWRRRAWQVSFPVVKTRQRKTWWVAFAISALLGACEQEGSRECTLAECSGFGLEVPLVDDAGRPVAAKGEYRTSAEGGNSQSFDCTSGARPRPYPDCEENRLQVGSVLRPGTTLEVSFQDASGAWSEWLPVALTLHAHTDPDFNGPGCPCTWYSADAEPLIVPAASQWQN